MLPPSVYDSSHGAEARGMGGFGLEDSFRPTIHQNTEDVHRSSMPTKTSGYNQTAISCIYKKDGTRVKPGQMQRHELSVNVPCCNIHVYPKENEHHPKIEATMSGSQGPPKALVEYDNFPPNKTIGPEMKVVIPPLPNHNNFSRSSPKDNGCQIQYLNVGARDWVSHFSPIHAPEIQDFTDSDSDWDNEAMTGFGGIL